MLITVALVAAYMLAEVIGGYLSNSLALLADAGHMFSDVSALGISLAAMYMARRPATPDRTYGFYRAEVLAALSNAVFLIVVACFILLEAFKRFSDPPPVEALTAMSVAVGGLAVNLAALWMLRSARDESLNVRGAWLHVMGDTLGSIGVIVSALLIWLYSWYWVDPLASLLIAALVVYSSLSLLKEVVSVLMEGTPAHIDVREVRDSICRVAAVAAVHDLHVWTISSGMHSLSGHVVIEPGAEPLSVLRAVRDLVETRFYIGHMTIQIEDSDFEENNVCH